MDSSDHHYRYLWSRDWPSATIGQILEVMSEEAETASSNGLNYLIQRLISFLVEIRRIKACVALCRNSRCVPQICMLIVGDNNQELSADIADGEILLIGGGALLRNLPK